MYNKISKEFKEVVKSNAVTASAKLTVYNDDGTTTLIDGNNLKTLKITDNCYTDGQIIGTACCKELDATVINNNYDLADKELDVEVGVEVPYATDEKTIIGKDISITNVVPNGYDYEIRGESTQKTRSGKNLWNNSQVVDKSDYILSNLTGFKLLKTTNGRITPQYKLDLKADVTYCISCKMSYDTKSSLLYCQWKAEDGTTIWAPNIKNGVTLFTPSQNIVGVVFYLQGTENDGTYVEVTNLQIEEGSTSTEYEAYGKSPSPDYLSKTESVSGKNYVDITINTQTDSGITFTVNADKSITINGTSTRTGAMFLRIGPNIILQAGTYTLSNSNANASTDTFLFLDDARKFNTIATSTKTFAQKTEIHPYIRIAAGATIDNQTIYPMIEKGPIVTDYVPYKSIAIRSTTKNLLNAPGEFELTGSKVLIPFYLKAGTYILSVENIETAGTTASLISFNTAAGTTDYYYLSNSSKSKTVTFKSDVMYYNIYSQNSYNASVGVTAVFTNLMIRHENSSAEYEPHISNQANITLLHPLRSLSDDIYDRIYKKDGKWYDEQKVDVVTYDGTEEWTYYEPFRCFYRNEDGTSSSKVNMKVPATNDNINLMCNHYKGDTRNNLAANVIDNIITNNDIYSTAGQVCIRDTRFSNVASFKAELAENNLEVQYELAAPITTEITDNETIQALEDMTLYDGVTNIASDAPIELTYKEKKVGTSIEYIPYGRYKVKKYDDTKSNNTYRIIAYDYMDRLNSVFEEFEASLYPMTLQTFYEKLAQQYGVTVKIQDLPNKDFIISAPPYFEGMSGRNVLKATAQLFGSFAKFNRSNRIQMYLQEETDEKISRNEMNSQLVIDNEYGPVNVLVLSLSQVTGENVTVRDETSIQQYGENIIEIQDNPFIYTQALREQVKDGIFNRIKGFRYIPTTFKYKAKLYIDCGDLIQTQEMKEDNYVNSIMLNQYIEIPSTRQSKCENKALTKTEVKNQFVPDEKERLKRAEISIDKQGVKIEQVTEKADKNTNDIASVTTTQTEQGLNIDALITKTSKIDEDGNATTVKTETGFTFDVNGLNIAEKKDGSNIGFNAQITPTGTHYKDGDSIIGEYTKDGSKQKNLELFGIYSYGMENIDDTAMFISQLYTDENGEECVGHFYNGE